MTQERARAQRGFSLVELLVVTAIIVVVAAVATPSFLNAMANLRLRTSASALAGVIQAARMEAVRTNRVSQVAMLEEATASFAFVDSDLDFEVSDDERPTLVQLQAGVNFDATGDPALTSMALGYTPVIGLPRYNTRGLPCLDNGGNCVNSGFIYYLRQEPPFGSTGWAAVTVSPTGRVRVWTWNGSAWK